MQYMVDSKQNWDIKLTIMLWTYKTTYKVLNLYCHIFIGIWNGIHVISEFKVPFFKIAIDECLDNSQSLMDRSEKLENLSKYHIS